MLIEKETNQIQGYYTLSNNSIALENFPDQIRTKLPKNYHAIPATLLGRLAVDKNSFGKGIRKMLLIDALKRCFENSKVMGSYAVVVDPIDKDAEKFYFKYGFICLSDGKKMFIAMKTLKLLFD
ncbi:MAG: GNAT family N-acetyltransferase [Flavobacteriales bacterium]